MAVLYDNIVTVIEDYLGPTGQRFVDRQIVSHLGKSPTEITSKDLDRLTDWIRVSLSLVTHDRDLVEECVDKLHQLT